MSIYANVHSAIAGLLPHERPTTNYVPPQSASLLTWVESDNPFSKKLSGTALTKWKDYTNNQADFVNTVAASKPTDVANSQNSLNGISWDATDDYLQTNKTTAYYKSLHDGNGSTGILVVKPTISGVFPFLLDSSGNAAPAGFLLSRNGATQTVFARIFGAAGAIATATAASNSLPNNTAKIISWTYSEAQSPKLQLFINGVSVATANTSSAPNSANSAFALTLGNDSNSKTVPGNSINYALMLWSVVLNSTDRGTEVTRLTTKFAIV